MTLPAQRTASFDHLLARLDQELAEQADPAHAKGACRYFKETIRPLGVRSAALNRIESRLWRDARTLPNTYILELCDALWRTGWFEHGCLACKLAARIAPRMQAMDFATLERWMREHVSNWAHCDGLATHALGSLAARLPELRISMAAWAQSDIRWQRRASALVLIPLTKTQAPPFHEIWAAADRLLADPDDLVQKGLGWLLKEAGRRHAAPTRDFLMSRASRMTRTALRIATEKLPPEDRAHILGRAPGRSRLGK